MSKIDDRKYGYFKDDTIVIEKEFDTMTTVIRKGYKAYKVSDSMLAACDTREIILDAAKYLGVDPVHIARKLPSLYFPKFTAGGRVSILPSSADREENDRMHEGKCVEESWS